MVYSICWKNGCMDISYFMPVINKNKPFYSRVYKIWESISIEGVWFLAEMHCQIILACQYSAPPYFCIPQGQPNPVSSKTLFGN